VLPLGPEEVEPGISRIGACSFGKNLTGNCDGALIQIRYKTTAAMEIPFQIGDFRLMDAAGRLSQISWKNSDCQALINLPGTYKIFPNYPNPFNAGTRIQFQTPVPGAVRLVIFNIRGERIHGMIMNYEKGNHSIHWDGADNAGKQVPGGLYFYRLEAGAAVANGKMLKLN
jgi:hypothetical protein